MWWLQKSGVRRWFGQRGQAMVEFAFVLPIMLLVLFAVVDFGVGLTRWIAITNAAREGARYGAVGHSAGEISDKVVEASDGILDASDVQVGFFDTDNSDSIDPGDAVVVDVNYDYELITPLGRFLIGAISGLSLSACSDMRLELFAGQSPGGPQGCN